jgi:hypothetical protein
VICYCCTAQGMHMHMWTMPCRGNDENRHAQLQSTRLTLTVLRASGQTASSHLTRIKITHCTCTTGGNVHVACRDRGQDGPFLFHRQGVTKTRFPPVGLSRCVRRNYSRKLDKSRDYYCPQRGARHVIYDCR